MYKNNIVLRNCVRIACICFFAVFLFVENNTAFAQMNAYNFGRTPSISPWVSMGNRPTGTLDTYNQYVRPQIDIQQAFRTQQAQIARQGYQQQNMQRDIGMIQAPSTTGHASQAATFRNYSHYYPNMGGRR